MTPVRRTALRLAAAAFVCLLAGRAGAADYLRADLKISDPWARASASKTAEAYLTVRNTGPEPERLLAISSPVAKRVVLVRYEVIGGVNGSKTVRSIAIPAGETITLAPSKTVLSLIGLKRPLRPGGTVTLTLTFARAGAVSVFAKVAEANATEPPPAPKDDKAKAKPQRR